MDRSSPNIVSLIVLAVALLALLCLTGTSMAEDQDERPREVTGRGTNFNVYVTEENRTCVANETTYVCFFSISIENIGDSLGDVTMYMSGFPNTGWDWQPNPGGTDHKIESIWPQDIKYVSLVIYASTDSVAGEYNLYLEVKPGGLQSEITLKVIVPQRGGVELTAPPSVETEPGNRVELAFQILNTGNGEDTFTIDRVDLGKPTWDAELVGGNKTTKVKPNRMITKILKVTVPYEAHATPSGKLGVRVSLTVKSDFDGDQEDGRGTYIKVLQFWALTFNVDRVNDTTRPGERVDFHFIVRNDGNGQDNITMRTDHSLEDWTIDLTEPWLDLPKDTGRQISLTVYPSETAIRGDYWLTITATSSGPADSPDQESQTLLITIKEVFNITMDVEEDAAPPMPPGGVAEYTFTVTNNGNTNDYVSLEVLDLPEEWILILDSEGIPLGPGQSKEMGLSILASPRLEESPAGEYIISLKGLSEGSLDIVIYLNLTCQIEPVGKIDLYISGDDTLSVNPYQKTNYNFIFDVENKGNDPDEINLVVSSTSWDPRAVKITPVLYPNILSVDRYSTKQVRLEVTVPKGTPLGYYDITVMAMSTLDQRSTRTLIVHVKVIQEDVTVQPISFKKGSEQNFRIWNQYRVKEGDVIYIGVPVSNNGSEVVDRINLKVYQDSKVIREENITSLGLLKTVVITVQWKATFLGTFKVKAVANIKGDSNIDDNTATAEIKVVDATTPDKDTEQAPFTSLGPGSPLFMILIIVVIVGILATVRYMLSLRAEQATRDLYESIYTEEVDGGGSQYPDHSEYDKGLT